MANFKPGDRAIIWRSRYCEEPKWAGRLIVLKTKPYIPNYVISLDCHGEIKYNRFIKFIFEDNLGDIEAETHVICTKAILKIKPVVKVEIGSWNECPWKPSL